MVALTEEELKDLKNSVRKIVREEGEKLIRALQEGSPKSTTSPQSLI